MDESEFARVYPSFLIVPERGIFPDVGLPLNFKELVPKFYNAGGRKRVERYATNLQDMLKTSGNLSEIRLNWDESNGLRNISVGLQGGLDLALNQPPRFQEHNLGWTNGVYAALIAIEYVKELLKQR